MSTKTLLTVEQFAQLPDEEAMRYELYHGELIQVSSSNPKHNRIRDNILYLFMSFLRGSRLGVAIAETEFQLAPDIVRRPDIAFLSSEQWAQVDPNKSIIPFAPQLVIEVASASDTFESMFGKAREYLAAGARAVWVLPAEPFQEVHVFEQSGARRLVRLDESLDLPDLLPGFSVKVRQFFEV